MKMHKVYTKTGIQRTAAATPHSNIRTVKQSTAEEKFGNINKNEYHNEFTFVSKQFNRRQ